MNAVMMSAVCSVFKGCVFEYIFYFFRKNSNLRVFEYIFKIIFSLLPERAVKLATPGAIIAALMLHAEIPLPICLCSFLLTLHQNSSTRSHQTRHIGGKMYFATAFFLVPKTFFFLKYCL